VQWRHDQTVVEQLGGLFAVERRIAALSRPHGVVGRDQLIAAGISPKVIANRVQARWLRPMHRGVYAVGGVQSEEAPEAAAVLACGDGSVLSHKSAAFLWRLVPRRDGVPMHVTVPMARCPRRPGIRVHRARELQPGEVTRLRGIRVTTPARTLLDVAGQLSTRELEQAVAKAERTYAGTQRQLLAYLPVTRAGPVRRTCVSCWTVRISRPSPAPRRRSSFWRSSVAPDCPRRRSTSS
jgi:Transcriptional regulator, AbiEi antitoxin